MPRPPLDAAAPDTDGRAPHNDALTDGTFEGPVKIRGSLRRLLGWYPSATFAINLVWGAVPSVLLPLQIQQSLGEADKVASLAIVSTIGGVASVLSQPIAGVLSDRTRSRWGMRTPWLVLGALIGGLSLVGMAFGDTLAHFVIGWVAIIIGFNFAQGPLSAILPDRVPKAVRGTFAAFVGFGAMLGAMGGQIFGASLSNSIPLAYLLLAGISILGTTLFVVFNRERPDSIGQKPAFAIKSLLSAFWVNPRRYPNFAWAFASRMMLYTGYSIVFSYKLYTLQDYVGLGDQAVTVLPMMAGASILGLLSTTLIAGRLSDRVGRRKIFVVVSALVVAGAVLIPLALPTTLGILLMAAIGGMGYGCFQAVDTALISEVLPQKTSFAKDLGVVNMAVTLPQVLAPSIAGLVVLASGGYAMLFPIGALCAITAAVLVTRVKSVR